MSGMLNELAEYFSKLAVSQALVVTFHPTYLGGGGTSQRYLVKPRHNNYHYTMLLRHRIAPWYFAYPRTSLRLLGSREEGYEGIYLKINDTGFIWPSSSP